LNLLQPINDITNGYPYGFLCLFLAASIYLAKDFARTNKKIIEQEINAKEMKIKQRLLKEEDARKSKELEDARQLQLSMLPPCPDSMDGIDICFYMQTATEVGGDYYDFHFSDNARLTLALGDATGHGMKAGIMVAVIKGLFMSYGDQTDIPTFFRQCTRTIKQMKFKNLFMALMVVEIKNRRLTVSSAGMPPMLIYRSKTKTVEEVMIKGIPLGVFDTFSYDLREIVLKKGDTVLLMSDGFTELLNDNNEMLDYVRTEKYFMEAAEKPPDQIVEHLVKAGEQWRQRRPQDDDITFIVFKIRD
jgi:serine phosphatase RsbU (regulator of sigma subunit)